MNSVPEPPTQEIAVPDGVAFQGSHSLAALAEQAAAVSFDFFDTLFIRPLLDPEDAFDLLGMRFGIPDFRSVRKQAQAGAFKRMQAEGRNEISLKGIYDCMPSLSVPRDALERAEYELELSLCYPNTEMVWLYEQLLAQGARVVITSDMYLPARFFEDALKAHGLPVVPVFASCDRDATKRDRGDLFRVVARELDVAPAQLLHIGDNPIGDVTRAREAGLQVFHYQASWTRKPVHNACVASSLSYGMRRTHAPQLEAYSFQELGYLYGGPATVGLLEWVRRQCEADSIDHVLFVSRDGYALERVADILEQEWPCSHSYFYGSRTAFSLAAMNEENFREFIPFLLSGADGLAPGELLERIGVAPPTPAIMNQLGLGEQVRVAPPLYDALAKFLIAYRWEILKVCARNRHALYRSLLDHGLRPGHRVALVDVGWNGTTQEAFERSLAQLMDITVQGYYLCLADTPERRQREGQHKMRAMVDGHGNRASGLYQNRVIVEQFFSAPHDSVIGLDMVNGEVVPVTDAGRGAISAHNDVASEITAGIEAFAKDFHALYQKGVMPLDPHTLIGPLVDLALHQGGDFRQVLERITNFDAWGSSRHRHIVLDEDLRQAAARSGKNL